MIKGTQIKLSPAERRRRVMECELRALRNQLATAKAQNESLGDHIIEMHKRRRTRLKRLEAKRSRKRYYWPLPPPATSSRHRPMALAVLQKLLALAASQPDIPSPPVASLEGEGGASVPASRGSRHRRIRPMAPAVRQRLWDRLQQTL